MVFPRGLSRCFRAPFFLKKEKKKRIKENKTEKKRKKRFVNCR